MTLLFLHGAGNPTAEDGSFGLLRRLVDNAGLVETAVLAPILPEPDAPQSAVWVSAITEHIQALPAGSTILTHSLGGSCTLQALASAPATQRVSRLILVAAPHWGIDPDWSVDSFELPQGYSQKLTWLRAIEFVYSRDDEVVPFTHMAYYQNEIPWATGYSVTGVDHTFMQGDISVLENRLRDGR